MARSVLILYESSEFMVDSLITNLKKAGLEANAMSPTSILAFDEIRKADVILLYIGDFIGKIRHVLLDLKNHCTENEKALCLIGYDKDIAIVEDVIPAPFIAHCFIRPFDVRLLSQKIAKLANVVGKLGRKRSILLINEEVAFLRNMLGVLSEKYEVTAVRSGEHAMKILASDIPDLIIMDYNMPVMSGPEVFEKIRKNPDTANVPIMFLTDMSDRETVMNAMQMKPEGYMLKSDGSKALLETISGIFVSRKWKNVK